MASPVAASLTRMRDGRILAVNRAWEELTGVARRQAIGRTTLELGHWADDAERERFLSQGPGTHPPVLMHLHGGQPHVVRIHSTVLPAEPEDLLLVYITEAHREVQAQSAQENTEQALRAANLELQQRVELRPVVNGALVVRGDPHLGRQLGLVLGQRVDRVLSVRRDGVRHLNLVRKGQYAKAVLRAQGPDKRRGRGDDPTLAAITVTGYAPRYAADRAGSALRT